MKHVTEKIENKRKKNKKEKKRKRKEKKTYSVHTYTWEIETISTCGPTLLVRKSRGKKPLRAENNHGSSCPQKSRGKNKYAGVIGSLNIWTERIPIDQEETLWPFPRNRV